MLATLGRAALMLSLAAVLGLLAGRVAEALAVALAGLLAWHYYNLHALERWLRLGPPLRPPVSRGLWSVAFERLYRLKRTEWRRKRRLAALLRQFREATAALPDGVVVLNRAHQVLWFNAAGERLLGLKPSQDIGSPVTNIVRTPEFAQWLDAGPGNRTLSVNSPEDESVRLSLRYVPYTDGQSLILIRDDSHLQRLEQVRQDFVANASHELRTPLTVIAGYLEALEEDEVPAWSGAVREMRQQARQMTSIVEDMLNLSRLDAASAPAPLAEVDVSAMLDGLRRDAEALSEGRHRFNFEAEPGLGLRGDAGDLRSAFANLVTNAVRYTQEGGEIIVRWRSDDGSALFEVEDNGPGIPEQHIARLTERFYRVSPSRSRATGGTGLGLSIVKHVLGQHQAELSIESKVGHGSMFTCLFPAERVVRSGPQGKGVVTENR